MPAIIFVLLQEKASFILSKKIIERGNSSNAGIPSVIFMVTGFA